jgi:hypothetical protein
LFERVYRAVAQQGVLRHSIYEHKVDVRVHQDLIRRAVDTGRRMNDGDTNGCVTRSAVKRQEMCIEVEGGHFEQMLEQ